jgi:hypothetical protein
MVSTFSNRDINGNLCNQWTSKVHCSENVTMECGRINWRGQASHNLGEVGDKELFAYASVLIIHPC